jgi:hypothetical protein
MLMWQCFLDRKLGDWPIRDVLIVVLTLGGGSWCFGWLLPWLYPIAVALVRSSHQLWEAYPLVAFAAGGAIALVVANIMWLMIIAVGMFLLRLAK